jgi:hypothetical protein
VSCVMRHDVRKGTYVSCPSSVCQER